jgi:adenine-specific DNA methylase
MDPPYYNNVQYGELSDFFYVWQKRTLKDLYPDVYSRRLTNKTDEAVANPVRDGGREAGDKTYEELMAGIFSECRRVIKPNGIMTIMFNHKDQEAWEALTRSLIESGWAITASFPVESESSVDIHHKEVAATQSSIFLSCRKREASEGTYATWTGFGGSGVRHQVQEAVREGLEEFRELNLNPVDEMVASYGRALRVLSQNWPVLDGDKEVSPLQAMNEASRVVAENQVSRITHDRLQVADLNPEAAMALTIYGIYGLAEFPYDDALNLSRSLRVRLENVARGYEQEGRMIGVNDESRGSQRGAEGDEGYFAPLVRSGSKLRLALPSERHPKRLENPQTAWDLLHGLLMAYREGDVPVARAYLQEHAGGRESLVLDLLRVWTAEMGDEELRKEGAAVEFGLADS